jgi:hypothetical protein
MAGNLTIRTIETDNRITAQFSEKYLPRIARHGELFVVDGILYIFADLDSSDHGRWFPLTNEKEINVFNQTTSSDLWDIPVDFHTNNLQVIVYDETDKIYPHNFNINIETNSIKLAFDKPLAGKAYLIVNKLFEWIDKRLIVGKKKFVVSENSPGSENYYIEINTEYVNILKNGNVSFSKNLDVGGSLSVNGNSEFKGNQNFKGSMDVSQNIMVGGNITCVNKLITTDAHIQGSLQVSGNVTLEKDLNINGNFLVKGTTTYINTEEIKLADNIITLNANSSGTPTENAGIEISRGNEQTITLIQWDESQDKTNIPNNTRINNNLEVDKNTTIYGSLLVKSTTTMDDDLFVNADVEVKGETILRSGITVNKDLQVDGTSKLIGSVEVVSSQKINQNLTVGGNFDVVGKSNFGNVSTFSNDVVVNTNQIIHGNLQVGGSTNIDGNLTIKGENVNINTSTLNVRDNVVTLNKGTLGEPTFNAGLEVDRGNAGLLSIVTFNETTDVVTIPVKQSDGVFIQDEVAGKMYVVSTLSNTQNSLQSNLNSEIQRATDAEVLLQSNINLANDTRLQTASDLITKINTEKERALLAETDLQKNINTEQSARISQDESLTNKLNSEIQRATDAEKLLQQNINLENDARLQTASDLTTKINTEKERATTEEQKLQSNINTEQSARISQDESLTSKLNSEIQRATDAEVLLQSNINKEKSERILETKTLTNDLMDETDRATTSELKLQSNIDVEKGRIDSMLLAASADLDSFKQVVDLINSVDTTNDTAFSGYVLSNDARSKIIEDGLKDEIQRATDAEVLLQSNIDTEQSERISQDESLTTKINTEKERATTEEQKLQSNIDTEQSARIIQDESLTNKLNSEIQRATTEEQKLQNALDGKQPLDASTVHDSNYVHTDNNYTSDEKIKLSGIESGAQVNKVTSVAGKDGAVTLNIADIIVDGHIIPTKDIAFDLGSETHRFRDLWLSSNTIKMGDFGISVTENGTITTSHLSNPNSSVDEILTDTDIGVLVQRYDVSTVHDDDYVHTDNNYTTDEKTKLSYLTVTQTVDLDGIESKLNGVENGATADQTASEILELLTTVDGENSGIDADLLDGKHGSHYQPAETAVTVNSEFDGDVSGNFNSIVIKDNSHQHSSENISDATDTNVVSTIVKRDAFGNFDAGQITAELKGNSTTSTALKNPRNINGVAFDGSSDITINAVDSTARIAESKLGTANGVATLDSNGRVPSTQLPSYVDDVLEFDTTLLFPETGDTGILYVALDTNKVYRWSGTTYIYITSGAVDSVAGKKGVVTLADMGLDNVDNTSDMNKPVSTAQAAANTLIKNDASTDATEKANAAQANAIAASAPASHVGSGDNAHTTATTSTHGFMSSDDKQKLDGIAQNANNYPGTSISQVNTTSNDIFYPIMTHVSESAINAAVVSTDKLKFDAVTGQLSATNFNSTSDVKKKTNVKTIEGALDLVMSMRGVEFNWIDTGLPGIGVIAQEVESVIPQIVSTDANGDKSVAYGNIIGILIEAIKQQQLMINQLLKK